MSDKDTLSISVLLELLLLMVLMAALPGLRRVQQVDLGRVSKSQSL